MTQWAPTPPFDHQQEDQSSSAAPRKRSKWLSIGVPVICSLLAFGLGSAAGGSGSAAERSSLASAEQELKSELVSANLEIEDAESVVAEAEQEATEARDELDQRLELTASLEAEVQEHATQVSELTSNNEALAAQVAELEAATQAVQFVDTPVAEEVPPPTAAATYYENCSAVRAAGASPLFASSPGYASHLDRDGDGVACE
ncbi:excalibur calcium-binding domain-containing protein [Leucobacter sp. NPDC077196]|uniref:excalibur calcium-binding domain-containing protein n=1 Tax=Leucobacter sp. NPDC077196 TaxID=3154959 RepID=UPI00341F3CB5